MNYVTQSPVRFRTLGLRAFSLVLVALATLGTTAPAQSNHATIASGVYTDPNIWDTGVVPPSNDNATISAGTVVGITARGAPTPGGSIVVGELVVDGALLPTYPEGLDGRNLSVAASSVVNNGTIQAERNPNGVGGFVRIAGSLQLGSFINYGSILGGDGDAGGGVSIDFTNGLLQNHSLIKGGNGKTLGGNVVVTATEALNDGIIEGGSSTNNEGLATPDGRGGEARLVARPYPGSAPARAENLAGGLVKGGDVFHGGRAGDAYVLTVRLPFLPGTALNESGATIRAGDATGPVGTLFGGNGYLLGPMTINRGSILSSVLATVDPPDGLIEGDACIQAEIVELFAGSCLTIRNLNLPQAIWANQDLRISIAPGGTLDLTGLAPGCVGAGGNVLIEADNILPAGVNLANLFTGSLTIQPGQRRPQLITVPDTFITALPGEAFNFDFVLGNVGNTSEDINVVVTAPAGLSLPAPPSSFNLGSMGFWASTAPLTVPPSAIPGTLHTITITATTTTPGVPPAQVTGIVDLEIGDPTTTFEGPYLDAQGPISEGTQAEI
ncbi:MAG: hypothetical protein CMJ83_04945, partial [Planctomycetes bacterium]|nr:hypothetical protein [Planctomycetota bacterium]